MRFSTSTLGANYHFQPKSVVDPNHLGNVLTVVSDKKIALVPLIYITYLQPNPLMAALVDFLILLELPKYQTFLLQLVGFMFNLVVIIKLLAGFLTLLAEKPTVFHTIRL